MTGNKEELARLGSERTEASRAMVPHSNPFGRWSIGLAAVLTVALVSVLPAFANGEDDSTIHCDLSTLKGQYLAATSGMVFPPAFRVTEPTVSAVAAYSTYNGDGTGEDHVTFTLDGINRHVPSPQPFIYTVNPDCTGTKTVNPSGPQPGPHFDIFVAFNGEAAAQVATDPGFSVATVYRRVGRSASSTDGD